MKRKYSSPVMEVEVFEASEYVAACWRCYSPYIEQGDITEQSDRALLRYNLYLDDGDNILNFEKDRGVSNNNICSGILNNKHHFDNKEPQIGFWNGSIELLPDENQYTRVEVINDGQKYHIVKHDSGNHS